MQLYSLCPTLLATGVQEQTPLPKENNLHLFCDCLITLLHM